MRPPPFTLDEIVSWFRLKQGTLAGSGVTLSDIRERSEHLPAAAADFNGTGTLGEIDVWASGEFDFHVLRASDGEDIFFRQLKVSAIGVDLESTYAEFLRAMETLA
jgi:hypothetical protein